MCTLQEHKSSRIPRQDKESLAQGNSQMHRTEPCGGLGDAKTQGVRTFASAAQILPIGTIGSRGVREIFFSECRQRPRADESATHQGRSFWKREKRETGAGSGGESGAKAGDRAQAYSLRVRWGIQEELRQWWSCLGRCVGQARGQEHC